MKTLNNIAFLLYFTAALINLINVYDAAQEQDPLRAFAAAFASVLFVSAAWLNIILRIKK